jgi:hypothetical protein
MSDKNIKRGIHYQFPLPGQIETLCDEYEDERRAYLSEWSQQHGKSDSMMKGVDRVADAMISGVAEPTRANTLWEVIGALLEECSGHEMLVFAFEEIDIRFAREALGMVKDSHSRFLALLNLAVSLEASWRARAFLQRVSRCYLYGFNAECVVMCRSVLESEFEAEVPNDDCITALGDPVRRDRKNRPIFDFNDRTRAAVILKRITAEVAQLSDDVREDGRDAVHRWPKAQTDPKIYIEKTLKVIAALHDQ